MYLNCEHLFWILTVKLQLYEKLYLHKKSYFVGDWYGERTREGSYFPYINNVILK